MKKADTGLTIARIVLSALLPFGPILLSVFDYQVVEFAFAPYAFVLALTAVADAVLMILLRKAVRSRLSQVLETVCLPLAVINWLFCLTATGSPFAVVCYLIYFAAIVFLFFASVRLIVLKVVSGVLSGILIFPLVFISFLVGTFGNISANTVVDTIPSPDGGYYAEVVDSDQGALGGNTLINVYENSGFSVGIFHVVKKPNRVYTGEWREYQSMQVFWRDEHCLMIGSTAYPIQ